MINSAAEESSPNSSELQLLCSFVLVLLLYAVSLEYTLESTASLIQSVIHKLRMRVVTKIWSADLATLEPVSHEKILNRLTSETALISESQQPLAAALYSLILVLATAIYLISLSSLAFVSFVILAVSGTLTYLRREQDIERSVLLGTRLELDFAERLADLLKGFKEAKIHHQRGLDLFEGLRASSREVRSARVETARLFSSSYVFSHGSFYVFIGLLLFLPSRWGDLYAHVLPELVATVLFIVGPLLNVVEGIPALTRANIAARSLLNLESELECLGDQGGASKQRPRPIAFQESIDLQQIRFSYFDRGRQPVFSIGPLNLKIRKGEILFIVGGNGDGKSTLLKILAGLHSPQEGQLLVDGRPMGSSDASGFRQLVSAVFAEFHLFRRLYGLAAVDESRIRKMLELLELGHKTRCVGGRFTNLDLSTGQSKRLALLVALLEDRPIYIFDEWAAEQDPRFKRYFYEDLLGELRNRGKTVIAVTHDEEYLHAADRVVSFVGGTLESPVVSPRTMARPEPAPDTADHPSAVIPEAASSALRG
ncbi:MAG: cyclic peptide export ABC transporter [Holophagales bacterium]|nr:cyclic peptide export ABC transporter [Holophagales bacterium]